MVTSRVREVPVPAAPLCPAGCRPLALAEGRRLLGLAGMPPGGPCPWCLDAFRDAIDPGRPSRPLVPRTGRRLPGGGHEVEEGRWEEIAERLAGALEGRVEAIAWIEPETGPGSLLELPRRVAGLGVPVHLVRVPEAGRELARRLGMLLAAERFRDPVDVRPGRDDLVLSWDVDDAGGWSWEGAWLRAAGERGARVVRLGPLARTGGGRADVPVPPGWDGAVALALAAGGGTLAVGGWSLRRAASELGIDEEVLFDVDRLLGSSRARYLVPGTPLAAASPATLAALALMVRERNLSVVLPAPPAASPGSSRVPGGRVVPVRPEDPWRVLEELDPARVLVVVAEIDPLAFLPGAGRLVRFLDSAALVVAFGPWHGPLAGRADLVHPLPGLLARPSAGPGEEGPGLALPGGSTGALATWRRVGRRLGAPTRLFEEDGLPWRPAGPGSWRESAPGAEVAPPGDPGWRPDPALAGSGAEGLVFLGRRLPPDVAQAGDLPRVLVSPGTAEARDLAAGDVVLVRAGDGRARARLACDESLPGGLALYGALPLEGSEGLGRLAGGPWRIGAVAPFRGEIFPAGSAPQA